MDAEPDARQSTCDVLVIDDDVDTLDLVLAFFLKKGVRAMGLSLSKDYMGAIRNALPRMVLLDVMMPGFNGYDLCRDIKRDPILRTIDVYFLTAMPPQDVARHVQLCGADGFIAKPFTLQDLEIVVTRARAT